MLEAAKHEFEDEIGFVADRQFTLRSGLHVNEWLCHISLSLREVCLE